MGLLSVTTASGHFWLPASHSGLSAWYEGDSGLTATSWADKTGHANNLSKISGTSDVVIVPNSAGLSGALQQSAQFIGAQGLVTASDASLMFGTGDYTYFILIRPSLFNDAMMIGVSDYDGASYTSYSVTQSRSGTTWRFDNGNAGQGGSAGGFNAGSPSADTWYPLVITRRSGTNYIYQNGSSVGSQAQSFAADMVYDRLSIGSSPLYSADKLTGLVAIAGVYKGVGADATLVTQLTDYMRSRGGF